MKLIDNWRQGWKFWSVRFDVIGLALIGAMEAFPQSVYYAWGLMPDSLKSHMGTDVLQWVAYSAIVASIIARFIKQKGLENAEPAKKDS